jgi:hypothetical protein
MERHILDLTVLICHHTLDWIDEPPHTHVRVPGGALLTIEQMRAIADLAPAERERRIEEMRQRGELDED